MNITFVDLPDNRSKLLPLTFTRPVSHLRIGILKIYEKWLLRLGVEPAFITEPFLVPKYSDLGADRSLLINGSICPDDALIKEVMELKAGQSLMHQGTFIAARTTDSAEYGEQFWAGMNAVEYEKEPLIIRRPWDIFLHNKNQIVADFTQVTHGLPQAEISDPNVVMYGRNNIFIAESAKIKACIIDAESGPVYIGPETQIHPGAVIQGPFALCEGSHVNMGAKMKSDTTIGPYCKVGGEISNSVLQGYTNKGHEGYLGNAVLGEWCNLGADTNNSNLKNNYTAVKAWDYETSAFINTELQFCGLIMGDHSKCGINTMFNTGTVVGVGANIFGAGFPRNFIPSFAWGGTAGFATFGLRRALETAEIVMKRRSVILDDIEKAMLSHVFESSKKYRVWEKNKQS